MSESVDALKDFWRLMETQPVNLVDLNKLKDLMSKVFLKIEELEKSRDAWRKKYEAK